MCVQSQWAAPCLPPGARAQSARLVASMIFVYGDDSYDEQQQRVCAVAVVFGFEDQWKQFESKWIARNGIIPFHARDCESDQGDYRVFCHQQNKELYKDCATMLASSGLGGRSYAINLMARQNVFPASEDVAYYHAFANLMEAIKDLCVRLTIRAEFIFDIQVDNEYNAGSLYDVIRRDSPEMIDLFVSKLSFGRAQECARLQAADLFAFESMKRLDSQIGPVKRDVRKSYAALHDTGQFWATAFSHKYFEDLKRNMPELEKLTGCNQNEYTQWLKQRKRQHSVSSMIAFSDWLNRQRH